MTTNKPTALITGGSRGIGKALVELYVASGYHVVTTCTTEDGKELIKSEMPNVEVIVWNAQHEGIELITRYFDQMAYSPSVLICNAGAAQDGLVIRMKEQQWTDIYKINTLAPCLLSAWAMRKMYAQKQGNILFISSVVAHTGNAGQANYITSKAAVEGLTKALAIEGGPRKVRVNCIAPGLIETDMTQALNKEHLENTLKRIPLSRAGHTHEIAKCALFLTQDATYITGQVLHVNGGLFFSA